MKTTFKICLTTLDVPLPFLNKSITTFFETSTQVSDLSLDLRMSKFDVLCEFSFIVNSKCRLEIVSSNTCSTEGQMYDKEFKKFFASKYIAVS